MLSLEWHEGLATGDEVIDRQHREICQLTKDLVTAVGAGGDPIETERVLRGLMRYVLTHFTDEEALMARVGYPGLEHQRELHAEYKTTAASLTAAFLDKRVSADFVLDYMVDWWADHICGEDLKLAEYVRDRSPRGFDA